MSDPYRLQRFIAAQKPVYQQVCAELRAGHKQSHWIWFIFPQIAGLGRSSMAHRYAIQSRAEAAAYLQHPVLGARLRECAQLLGASDNQSIEAILGGVDAMKLRSSMTLFANATADNAIFTEILYRYFDGQPDKLTLQYLGHSD